MMKNKKELLIEKNKEDINNDNESLKDEESEEMEKRKNKL